MAEEVLIAELRAQTAKFEQDMKRATDASQKATKDIVSALNGIDSSIKDLPKSFNKLNAELQQTQREAQRTGQSVNQFGGVLKSMKGTLAGLGIAATAHEFVEFAQSIIRASEVMTGATLQLTRVTGSLQAARNEMAFIREQTERFAQSTVEATQAYARLANAAEGTAAEGEGVRRIFEALNTITVANAGSTADYGRVMNQVVQIMAKGRVTQEELTTISEHGIPAQQLLAKAMGTTTTALSKMTEAGKVSSDVMILLAESIIKDYAPVAEKMANTIPADFRRGADAIKNEFVDLTQGILESKELIESLNITTDAFDIFPDKAEITQQVDSFVREITALAGIIEAVFAGIDKFVRDIWDGIAGYVSQKVSEITKTFDEMNRNAAQMANKLSGGLLFPNINKPVEDAKKGVEDVGKAAHKVDQESKGYQGLLGLILGTNESDLATRMEKIREGIEKAFGVESMPMMDGDEIGRKADAANKEVSASHDNLVKELKEKYKKLQDDIAASRKKSLTTEEKEAERVGNVILAMRKSQRQKDLAAELEAIEEAKKRRLEAAEELRELLSNNEARIAQEAAQAAEMAAEAERTGIPVLEMPDDQKKALEEAQKTYDTFKENVQETLAELISDSLKGDFANIKDTLDNILDLFATFASEAAAKLAIDAVFDKAYDAIMGKDDGKGNRTGGLMGARIPGLGGGTVGQGLLVAGAGFAGGQIGSGIGGAVGGKRGSIVGGVAGGALAGAAMGGVMGAGVFSLPAAAIGAVVGAVVGGITSAIQSGAFSREDKSTLGVRTGIAPPGDIYQNTTKRSPFGVLNLFDESDASENLTEAALTLISETDRAIATHLDKRQREIIENYFQTAIPDGNLVSAEVDEDAIAKLVAQRYYQAITALAGQDIAENVVGSPFGATKGNLGAIQQRANEALALLKTIEEFKIGPITDVAASIKGINEQFQALIDRATTLGLPTDTIMSEQQRQLTEITTNFNEGITDSILAIKDPVAAEFAALAKEQEDRRKNAVDAEADLTKLSELEALEREELAKRLNTATDSTGQATDALTARLQAFQNQGLSGASQQILALQATFVQLRNEMAAAGMDTSALTAAYQQQAGAIRAAAQTQVLSALYAITDPFKAAMLSMGQQVQEFSKLVAEGIIPQSTLDSFVRAATEQARYQEAMRLAGGQGDASDQFQAMVDGFTAQTTAMSDAEREMAALTTQFQNLSAALVFLGVDTANIEAHYAVQMDALKAKAAEEARVEAERAAEEKKAAAQQAAAERQQIAQQRAGFYQALYGLTNPFKAAMLSMQQQVIEFQALVAQGIIPQSAVDAYVAAATKDLRYQEAGRIASGQGNAEDQFNSTVDSFVMAGKVMSDTQREIAALTFQFQNLMAAMQFLGQDTSAVQASYNAQVKAIRQREAEQKREEARARAEERRQKAEQRRQEIESYNDSRMSFLNASRSDARQQLHELAKAYKELVEEGRRLGQSTKGLASSYRQQAQEIRMAAKESVLSALYGITNPFKAAMLGIAQQTREFQQLAADGIVPRKDVNRYRSAAVAQARRDETDRRLGARESVQSAIFGITNSFKAAMLGMQQQIREFQDLTRQGLVSKKMLNQYKRLALGQVGVDDAQSAIGGGARTTIEGISQSFRDFVQAANPLSDSAMRMRDLTNEFRGLMDAAGTLRLNTEQLRVSYLKQSQVIRQEAIKAIDDQLEAQRDQIKSIGTYLSELKQGEDVPYQMRLNESRQQFLGALRGGDIDEALSTAESFRSMARESYGGTEAYFNVKSEIERLLGAMKEREQLKLDAERERLIRQEDRDLQRLQIGRNSLNHLQLMRGDTSAMARSIRELIAIARSEAAASALTQVYIKRAVDRMKA